MKVPRFELERWQSIWEHRVEINVAESGVDPMALDELLDSDERSDLAELRLGYPQTNGSEQLRCRIAGLYPETGPTEVLVTCGCAEANYLAAWHLLGPGDEVVFSQPNYMQLSGLAHGFGATVKPWWLLEGSDWQPDVDELERLVTERTRLIAVCNPNNPTGAVLGEPVLERICAVAERVGAWVLSDEVYRGAELEGDETPSLRGRYDRLLCTGGLSKSYGLPGLRVGWIVAPAETIDRLWAYHDYTSICPTTLSDSLATVALEPDRRHRIRMRARRILVENYALVRDWVERGGGAIRHVPPRAGAVAWLAHSGCEETERFAGELRRCKSVLVVPGEQFCMASYLRIGFGGEREPLRTGLQRIDELLAKGF